MVGTSGKQTLSFGLVLEVSQTTLSVDDTAKIIDALRASFPGYRVANGKIIFATLYRNRQGAVKKHAEQCDRVLVVGSANSSHSSRLNELAQRHDIDASSIDGANEIDEAWLQGKPVSELPQAPPHRKYRLNRYWVS